MKVLITVLTKSHGPPSRASKLAVPIVCEGKAPKVPYLDPQEPTFSGFFIMNSLYKSLKRVGYLGLR